MTTGTACAGLFWRRQHISGHRRGDVVAIGWLPVVALALGCGTNAPLLAVDVRTDFVPGVEFTRVRTEIEPLRQFDDRTVRRGEDFLTGERVAEARVPRGSTTTVTVHLFDAADQRVASRSARVDVRETLAITLLVTRDCRGVSCDDHANESTCIGGRCGTARCIDGTEPGCPAPECFRDTDCTAVGPCAVPRCSAGSCTTFGDESQCGEREYCDPELGCRPLGEGPVDAGADAGLAPCVPWERQLVATAGEAVRLGDVIVDGSEFIAAFTVDGTLRVERFDALGNPRGGFAPSITTSGIAATVDTGVLWIAYNDGDDVDIDRFNLIDGTALGTTLTLTNAVVGLPSLISLGDERVLLSRRNVGPATELIRFNDSPAELGRTTIDSRHSTWLRLRTTTTGAVLSYRIGRDCYVATTDSRGAVTTGPRLIDADCFDPDVAQVPDGYAMAFHRRISGDLRDPMVIELDPALTPRGAPMNLRDAELNAGGSRVTPLSDRYVVAWHDDGTALLVSGIRESSALPFRRIAATAGNTVSSIRVVAIDDRPIVVWGESGPSGELHASGLCL